LENSPLFIRRRVYRKECWKNKIRRLEEDREISSRKTTTLLLKANKRFFKAGGKNYLGVKKVFRTAGGGQRGATVKTP